MDILDELQGWIGGNRKQAELIRYFIAIDPQGSANESLSAAQADTLEATADGWQKIYDEVAAADQS